MTGDRYWGEEKIRTSDGKTPIPVPREQNGVVYMQFPGLDSTGTVRHLFSTRIGGVSHGQFSSMNLSFLKGENREHVLENFRRVGTILGCNPDRMVYAQQTHTRNLKVVSSAEAGMGITRERNYTDIDGLVTDDPSIVLVTSYADCVPLFFVDPVKRVIGLSHSGWKGTRQGIGEATVQLMKENYGSRPGNIHAAIGPTICGRCYEVGEDLFEAFMPEFYEQYGNEETVPSTEDTEIFERSQSGELTAGRPLFLKKENGKYQLDLKLANEMILLRAGIRKENIEIATVCTACNPELLFSHRASKGKRGNLCAFLGLL